MVKHCVKSDNYLFYLSSDFLHIILMLRGKMLFWSCFWPKFDRQWIMLQVALVQAMSSMLLQ